jgi:hypothetical protein
MCMWFEPDDSCEKRGNTRVAAPADLPPGAKNGYAMDCGPIVCIGATV